MPVRRNFAGRVKGYCMDCAAIMGLLEEGDYVFTEPEGFPEFVKIVTGAPYEDMR
jgi:hypothetical protein